MKVKNAELVNLQNMTVLALDDISIFIGSQAYVSNVRFHIVPNKLLPVANLDKLPEGTTLPSLVMTKAGGVVPIRINYVRIKVPDVMRNLKIMVHSVYFPFPHLQHVAAATSYDDIIGGDGASLFDQASGNNETGMESCAAVDQAGGCVGAAPSPQEFFIRHRDGTPIS